MKSSIISISGTDRITKTGRNNKTADKKHKTAGKLFPVCRRYISLNTLGEPPQYWLANTARGLSSMAEPR